jgi:hypothetical protein
MSDGLKPYSVHSFMLPFRWDYLPANYSKESGKEQISFEQRTDLNNFLKSLLYGNTLWKRKFYSIEGKAENFNEVHYFHAYASKTMFDLQQKDELDANCINSNKVMVYFEIETDPQTDTYTIKTVNDGTYILGLCGISLHVYNTGVAILTINLENTIYDSKEAVLCINEYGRRIYPQFLHEEYPHVHKVKEAFLPDSIEMSIAGRGDFSDDFGEYKNLEDREVHHYESSNFIHSWVVRVPKYIRSLFGDKFSIILNDETPDSIRLNVLTDDRMFFQSWYGNNELADILKETLGEGASSATGETFYPYLKNSYWHAYLFGDKGWPSIANKKMQEALTERHTYARWAGCGTLYGFTKDSFVSITDSSDFSLLIKTHFKTIYYQMAVLCLAQRVSVLRFSSEVSNLSDLARSNENEKLVTNIKILYKNYIEFINKIYYREITPYVQGIEMYNQFQEIMDLKENVKDLDEELNELFNYVKLEESEKQSNETHRLSTIAAWFLPASFIASLFGIGLIDKKTRLTGKMDFDLWIVWGIICGGGILLSLILFKIFKWRKGWKK